VNVSRIPLFASLLLFICVPPLLARDRPYLPPEVERAMSQRKIPGTSLSVLVREVGREEPLLSYNADVPRNPASTIKVLTTYAALELLGPVLDGYRAEQRAGAGGTSFQRDLAYALFVEAIAQPADATGRARRATALAAAQREFDALSSEVRQESDVRDLGAWIASARATPAS